MAVLNGHDKPLEALLGVSQETQGEDKDLVSIDQLLSKMLEELVLQCMLEELDGPLAAAAAGGLPPEPLGIKEALATLEAKLWKGAMLEEFAALRDKEVFKLIPRSSGPAGRQLLKGRWFSSRS
jgi:hypothetical protein